MKTVIDYRALDSKVLAVVVINYLDDNVTVFDWAVYIGAVKGYFHKDEAAEVAKHGSKASIYIAEILFPMLEIGKYRN